MDVEIVENTVMISRHGRVLLMLVDIEMALQMADRIIEVCRPTPRAIDPPWACEGCGVVPGQGEHDRSCPVVSAGN
jgi:hypothetical protein